MRQLAKQTYEDMIPFFLASIFFVLGVISNSKTMTVFCKGKRCPKSDFRVLIFNLCAANLLLTATLILNPDEFNIRYMAMNHSISLCRFFDIFGILASPYANLAIAIQRTFALFRPTWSHRNSTITVLIITWFDFLIEYGNCNHGKDDCLENLWTWKQH